MTLFALFIGFALPTLGGWLLLSIIEGNARVLLCVERWILGFVIGVAATMYVVFLLAGFAAMPLTRTMFLATEFAIVVVLAIVRNSLHHHSSPTPSNLPTPPSSPSSPLWLKLVLATLITWTIGKALVAGTVFLLLTPAYLDDTVDNWNLRGKVFFHSQQLALVLPGETPETAPLGVSSYPPAVPLFKASLAALAGDWSEPFANAPHLLWYFAALALVYTTLRRCASRACSALGAYGLGSIPLYLMHGSNPYADAFLSLHILAAVAPLLLALTAGAPAQRMSFLRITGIALSLLPFTKNEGLLLYFFPLALLFIATLLWMQRHNRLSREEALQCAAVAAACAATVLLPWLLFKWQHGMAFGNAKPVTSLNVQWQEGVLYALWVNTFFEGNWNLLFPVAFAMILLFWRSAFRPPFLLLTAFVLIIYLGQMPLFLFTNLATEALRQTGYARGLIHIVPVLVLLTTLLANGAVCSDQWQMDNAHAKKPKTNI